MNDTESKDDKAKEYNDAFRGWNREKELLLSKYSDNARTYEYLHNEEFDRIWYIKFFLIVPVIFIGTLTGGGNLSISIFPPAYTTYVNIAFGLSSLLSSFISAITYYFEVPKTLEDHRISRYEWGLFSRDVNDILSKKPCERKIASETLKMFSDRYNDLMKKSPSIQKQTIDKYNNIFKDERLQKPEICGKMVPASEFVNLSYYDITESKERARQDEITISLT